MISLARLPQGLSFWHPAALIATVGGIGLLPRAPGTWGSLVALIAAFVIRVYFGPTGLALATGLVFLIGWWAASRYIEATGEHDPGPVVIDEVAGQWLVLIFTPIEPGFYLAAFALFRLTDILKPWPVSLADRVIGGGFGVMFDDILAAIYAIIALMVLMWLTGTG